MPQSAQKCDLEVSSRDDLSECAWKCRNVDVYSQANHTQPPHGVCEATWQYMDW